MGYKPRIRFKGFTEDWEQRKLNDFGIATGGTSIESEFVDGGTYKVISIGSYSEESVYNDQGLRVNKTDKTKFRILNKDDLTMILNDKTASGNIIGRVLLIDQDNTYVYNQRTERIEVDTKNFLPMFLYHMLNAPEQRKYIVKASQGNTQIYVNWSTINNIDYMIPQLLLEQEKIANLFSLINKDITLHQCKLEKLKLTKKALLQKLFPKNGKHIPEIRFKGFTDAWEQRKLGNLTQLITKGTTPKVKNIQNGINFIKVENISDDGVISINSYVSEEEHMNYLSRSILANNDILFSIAGTLGRTAIVKSHLLPANTNQALAIIRLNKSVDVEYINTSLKSNAIKTYIRKNPTVGAQPNLSLGQVSDLEINIPNYSEQKKISNLFSKFDLMITLHQRKLERLQEVKKGLLQKMFV